MLYTELNYIVTFVKVIPKWMFSISLYYSICSFDDTIQYVQYPTVELGAAVQKLVIILVYLNQAKKRIDI